MQRRTTPQEGNWVSGAYGHGTHRLSLGYSSWEPVKNEPVPTLLLVKVILDDTNDQLVRNKLTGVHDLKEYGSIGKAQKPR
jgi:hypothetical protein